LKQLTGNLGRGVIKVSAVAPERHVIEAPARVFHDQDAVKAAFKAGEFTRTPWSSCASRGRRPTACRNCIR
jgi:dihydroxyacid dehydratase/phosphogluconate dehydratase